MPHALSLALFVCLLLPLPALGITYGFTGTVETVHDDFGFLDASVDPPDLPVTGSLDIDLSSTDTSSPFGVGLTHLSFQLGNYLFDASQNPHSISLIDNRDTGVPGVTVDVWQLAPMPVSDLSPATQSSGNFAGYAAQIEFFDNTSSQFHGTETAPMVPSSLAGWDQARLTPNALPSSGNVVAIDGRVQVQVNLGSWEALPVPEPRTGPLVALGLASLGLRARCRARS